MQLPHQQCASALEHEAINVGLISRMLERGTEQTPIQPQLPDTSTSSGKVVAGRFARAPEQFATHRASNANTQSPSP